MAGETTGTAGWRERMDEQTPPPTLVALSGNSRSRSSTDANEDNRQETDVGGGATDWLQTVVGLSRWKIDAGNRKRWNQL